MAVLRTSSTFAFLKAVTPQPNGTTMETATTRVTDNSSAAGSCARVMVGADAASNGGGDYYYAEFIFGSASVAAVLKIGKRSGGSDTVYKTVSLGTGAAFRFGQTVDLWLCVGLDRNALQAAVNSQVAFTAGTLIAVTPSTIPNNLPYVGIGTGGTVNTSLDFSNSQGFATDVEGCSGCYTNCETCNDDIAPPYVDVTIPDVFSAGTLPVFDANRNDFTSQLATQPFRCYLYDPSLGTGNITWRYKFPGTEPYGVPGYWDSIRVFCKKDFGGGHITFAVGLLGVDQWLPAFSVYNRAHEAVWGFAAPITRSWYTVPITCDESSGVWDMCANNVIEHSGIGADYFHWDGVQSNAAIPATNSSCTLEFGPPV